MKAAGFIRYLSVTDPKSLLDVDPPKPAPQGRDILLTVKAVAINPVDVKVRSPKEKVKPQPRVIGYDAAGVVDSVGPDATLIKAGDEAYSAGDLTRPGAIGKSVAARFRRCLVVSPEDAGTGLTPQNAAKLASDFNPSGLLPAVSKEYAALLCLIELRSTRSGARSSTIAAIIMSRSAIS